MELYVFMCAFMYELEEQLNHDLAYFDDVRFQFDEANTDQQIKIKIKNYILDNFRKIENIKEIYIQDEVNILNNHSYRIADVKVPSELNEDDRRFIKNNSKSVYTNPDLLFFVDTGKNITRIAVEVKSTKNDKIPGSSIQQINPDDWVIFIKHDDYHVQEIITGKYVESISGTIQFPDRSPRPQVSFNQLKNWNNNYRKCYEGKLEYLDDENIFDKLDILDDWQLSLATKWMEVLDQTRKLRNEPWFNNNIRKFSVLLLNYYETLTPSQKKDYISFIKENIMEDNDE